jgi:hypothetical protein
MAYEIVTLAQLKTWLNISGVTKDTFLGVLRDVITATIESYIDKPIITRQYTEYLNGQGQSHILVRNYPIYLELDSDGDPFNITLYDDTDRDFTSSDLISATDYVVDPDLGKISLYEDESSFADGRQNVQVTYWAGYSRLLVIDEVNNYLDVTDTGGTAAIEIAANSDTNTFWKGYNAESLASTLQTALNADTTLNGTYTVSYHHDTQKFTIACDENFTLKWSDGTNAAKSLGTLMGYTISANDTGAQTYTADNAVTGIPNNILLCANKLAFRLYDESKHGKAYQERKKETIAQGGTLEFVKSNLPKDVKMILDQYRRVFL